MVCSFKTTVDFHKYNQVLISTTIVHMTSLLDMSVWNVLVPVPSEWWLHFRLTHGGPWRRMVGEIFLVVRILSGISNCPLWRKGLGFGSVFVKQSKSGKGYTYFRIKIYKLGYLLRKHIFAIWAYKLLSSM